MHAHSMPLMSRPRARFVYLALALYVFYCSAAGSCAALIEEEAGRPAPASACAPLVSSCDKAHARAWLAAAAAYGSKPLGANYHEHGILTAEEGVAFAQRFVASGAPLPFGDALGVWCASASGLLGGNHGGGAGSAGAVLAALHLGHAVDDGDGGSNQLCVDDGVPGGAEAWRMCSEAAGPPQQQPQRPVPAAARGACAAALFHAAATSPASSWLAGYRACRVWRGLVTQQQARHGRGGRPPRSTPDQLRWAEDACLLALAKLVTHRGSVPHAGLAHAPAAASAADVGLVMVTLGDVARAGHRHSAAAVWYAASLRHYLSGGGGNGDGNSAAASAAASAAHPRLGPSGLGWDAYAGCVNLLSMLLMHDARVGASIGGAGGVRQLLLASPPARALAATSVGVASFRGTVLSALGLWQPQDDDDAAYSVRAALVRTLALLRAYVEVAAASASGAPPPQSLVRARALLRRHGLLDDAASNASNVPAALAHGLHQLTRIDNAFLDLPPWLPALAAHLQAQAHRSGVDGSSQLVDLLQLPDGVPTAASSSPWGSQPQRNYSDSTLLSLWRRRRPRVAIPLRLAYISGDFRQHVIGHTLHGVLASHARPCGHGAGVAAHPHAVRVSCYHMSGFNAEDGREGDDDDVDGSGSANRSRLFHIPAAAAAWGPYRDLRAAWSGPSGIRAWLAFNNSLVAAATGGGDDGMADGGALSIGDGLCPALSPARIEAQLAHPAYALHTPRLVEACDECYAPLLWHGGRPWRADDVVAHVRGDTPPSAGSARTSTGSGAHVAVDVSGPTEAGAPGVFTARAAPLQVHYMSGPLSVLHPRHADYFVVDAAVLPPEALRTTLPRCLPDALGLAAPPTGAAGGDDADGADYGCRNDDLSAQQHAHARVTLPSFTESPAYIRPTYLAGTHPRPQRDERDRALATSWRALRAGCDRAALHNGTPPLSSLSYSPPVLAALLSPSKVEPVLFTAWAQLLQQRASDSGGRPPPVLWLLSNVQSEEGDSGGGGGDTAAQAGPQPTPQPCGPRPADRWCDRMRGEAAARGVHPSRIVCLPRLPKAAYLRLYASIDLCLDARVYGGHTTAADGLRAGVPTLALVGDMFANRVSASLLTALDGDADAYAGGGGGDAADGGAVGGGEHVSDAVSSDAVSSDADGGAATAAAAGGGGGDAAPPLGGAVTLRGQLATTSVKAYQSQAVALLHRRQGVGLGAVRARLWAAVHGGAGAATADAGGTSTNGPLAAAGLTFDYTRTARRLERAYRVMWEARAATAGGVAGGLVVAPAAAVEA